jgi:pyruvate dehydrogenase E2 component (dihydrolipoamide acetyltransferase)
VSTIEVKVPDIGDFEDVPVIEVLVKPGDSVKAEDSLVTLESDKATMDVPSPSAGTVKALSVKVGDKVKEGSLILTLDSAAAASEAPAKPAPSPASAPPTQPVAEADQRGPRGEKGLADAPGEGPTATPPAGETVEVRVPDIGDFSDVPVIEIFVKPGDVVKVDDPLVTLESDKATMDVPSPVAGAVQGVRVSVGDRVSEGSVIATVTPTGAAPASVAAPAAAPSPQPSRSASLPSGGRGSTVAATQTLSPLPERAAEREESGVRAPAPAAPSAPVDSAAFKAAHASPSVRKFARELGVDLSKVKGSGPNGRILQEDVQRYVKQALAAPPPAAAAAAGAIAGGGTLNLLPWPKVDFAKFGATETKPLSRIKKISGQNLARNWVMIPHVTQFDEADITELEALRVQLNKEHEKAGVKFTMLAFLIKASVAGLKKFPDFNSSLDGDNLVYKQYYNIGFAADTPNGLVVPVVKGADQKGLVAIAKEMAELSAKAREGKLGPADMQGGCFSISSLGGIGGTAFTPIVNAPEVAILGVSKGATKPVWDGKAFVPKLMLPLSLSYDHRVIDGAQAARFTAYLTQVLADFRRVIL